VAVSGSTWAGRNQAPSGVPGAAVASGLSVRDETRGTACFTPVAVARGACRNRSCRTQRRRPATFKPAGVAQRGVDRLDETSDPAPTPSRRMSPSPSLQRGRCSSRQIVRRQVRGRGVSPPRSGQAHLVRLRQRGRRPPTAGRRTPHEHRKRPANPSPINIPRIGTCRVLPVRPHCIPPPPANSWRGPQSYDLWGCRLVLSGGAKNSATDSGTGLPPFTRRG